MDKISISQLVIKFYLNNYIFKMHLFQLLININMFIVETITFIQLK